MHLHTPYTKKNDRFEGTSAEEKWDNFYKSINDYIADGTDPIRSVCAVAITDYLSLENYFKVKRDKRLSEHIKLLLPNIELRMAPIAKKTPVNIHCIFSPDIDDQIETRFLSNLTFSVNDSNYNASKQELIRLGRDHRRIPSLSDEEAYRTGIEQFVLSTNVLFDVFKQDKDLRSKTIIVVSNSSNDGVSGITSHEEYLIDTESQLDATRQEIYQKSDMIFSANQNDRHFFLGESNHGIDVVMQKCGSLKPCIHGCDAHENAKIFAPVDDRFCWIKAAPTFEGLKQVMYEPKERVQIRSTKPEDKPGYHVIEKVEIQDDENFSPTPIFFSDNLTCIIGGKSTGKSLLLHNMALALDETQVQEKSETAKTNVKALSNIKVFWRDGTDSSQKEVKRKIVYIPQTYLNRLADEKEETTEIDSIIQDIVLQDAGAKTSYQSMLEKIDAHKEHATGIILNLCSTMKKLHEKKDEIKEIGDENGINNEISKLSTSLEKLSQQFNVTEEEINDYQRSTEQIKDIQHTLDTLKTEIDFLTSTDSVVDAKDSILKHKSSFQEKLLDAVESTIKVANAHWVKKRDDIISALNSKDGEQRESLKKFQDREAELKPKMEGNDQIKTANKLLTAEKERLKKLQECTEEKLEIERRLLEQTTDLAVSFSQFHAFYKEYVDCVNANFTSPADDLKFSANVVFRAELFTAKIDSLLNKKSLSRFTCFDLSNISEQDLSVENLKNFIASISRNNSDSLQVKGTNNTPESTLRDIFTDWYNIDYVVKMDDDSIHEMSPGKKALVLLKLLISLAESQCPILIDQPEDDLDNRSIFDELIQFIKIKKNDRQIIAVTHNANIVLGGDAELVIVANQQGKNAPNKEFKFEYRGGPIENDQPMQDGNGSIQPGILNSQGIQNHICEVLEGGEKAFALRKSKYHFITHQ